MYYVMLSFIVLVSSFQLVPIEQSILHAAWLSLVALLTTQYLGRKHPNQVRVALIGLAMALLFISQETNLGTAMLVPTITMIWMSVWYWVNGNKKAVHVALLSLAAIVVCVFQQTSAPIFHLLSRISISASTIPSLFGLPSLELRQSGSLLLILITTCLFCVIIRPLKWVRAVILNVLITVVYYFAIPAVERVNAPGLVLMLIQTAFAGVMVAVISLLDDKVEPSATGNPGQIFYYPAVVLLTVGTLLFAVVRIQSHHPLQSVTIIDTGESIDLESKVERGIYGLSRQGMYSVLIEALEARGCKTQVIPQTELNEESIRLSDMLLIISPIEYFTSQQKADIDRYMKIGGTVLLLGDHTNVFGLQGPLNDLASPYGVAINFDSALLVRVDRSRSFEQTEFLRQMVDVRLEPVISMNYLTGASLTTPSNAEVLLSFKYGFEDMGDINNGGKNAFLGDYRWAPSEEAMGDVILACRVQIGKGKFVAVGDTSIFQNVSITNHDAGMIFLGLLNNKNTATVKQVAVLVCLLLFQWTWIRREYRTSALLLVSCAITISLLFSTPIQIADLFPSDPPRAVIDISHSATVSVKMWDDNSVSGVAMSLRRAGYWPQMAYRDLTTLLPNAELLVIPDDSSSYNNREIKSIVDWVKSGGQLLCAARGDSHSPVLKSLGTSAANIPLGNWPNYALNTKTNLTFPQVINAWPIGSSTAYPSEALLSVWNTEDLPYDIIKAFDVGKGKVLVIGDTQILQNANLEGENTWVEENIHLLEDLLDYLKTQEI